MRGSIGTPVTRFTRVSSCTTCAARANAASTAGAFDGRSSQSAGAPGASAAAAVTTAGSGSYSTCTHSAPSRAAATVSATTMATGSPAKRARSTGSEACVDTKNGEPSGLLSGTSCGFVGTGRWGMGRKPARATSAPVKTAITPGAFSASRASIARRRAWPWGERTNAA